MSKKARRKCSVALTAAPVLCLLIMFECPAYPQTATTAAPPSTSPGGCEGGVSPGVIKLIPDTTSPDLKLKLARTRFYLSSRQFNLADTVNMSMAPSLRGYYSAAGASPQLIGWLEENHCETVYCRELTADEVGCVGGDQKKCVPEFVGAYRNALANLKGNRELARRLITNYPPLSAPALRVGFYVELTKWLGGAVEAVERAAGGGLKLRSAITNKDGVGFFYDLCPGSYYISSVAPVDFSGARLFWESARPVKVEGPPDVNGATVVTLAFPPAKDKKNFFVGKPAASATDGRMTPPR